MTFEEKIKNMSDEEFKDLLESIPDIEGPTVEEYLDYIKKWQE